MAKIRKVIKTGNSLSLTIPAALIKDYDIREGDPVMIKIRRSTSSLVYTFPGHPCQLSLIDKLAKKS
jgi:antitoxin component of MazEF toxin-antitoxin module